MILLSLLLACGETAPQAPAPASPVTAAPISEPDTYGLGRGASEAEIARLDKDVDPSWAGLPDGRGSVAEGKAIYDAKCLACHAPDAKGGQAWMGPRLVATEPLTGFAADPKAPKAVGNWWPYASTVFDYVYRTMPQTAPGSLTPDETYALVAFLLAENAIVPPDFVADQDTIKTVKMPQQASFVPDDRQGGPTFR